MAWTSSIRTMGKVGGMAATTAPYVKRAASTAPYVKRLATDDGLRDDVTDFIRSANNLLTHVRSDRQLRKDVNSIVESVQSGAEHLRSDVRPHHYLRNFFIGTGLVILGVAGAIALGWPRARQQVTRAVDQTATRATSTVHDVREKISGQSGEQAA